MVESKNDIFIKYRTPLHEADFWPLKIFSISCNSIGRMQLNRLEFAHDPFILGFDCVWQYCSQHSNGTFGMQFEPPNSTMKGSLWVFFLKYALILHILIWINVGFSMKLKCWTQDMFGNIVSNTSRTKFVEHFNLQALRWGGLLGYYFLMLSFFTFSLWF